MQHLLFYMWTTYVHFVQLRKNGAALLPEVAHNMEAIHGSMFVFKFCSWQSENQNIPDKLGTCENRSICNM